MRFLFPLLIFLSFRINSCYFLFVPYYFLLIASSNDNVMMSLEPKDVGTSSISFSSDSASLEMYSEAGNESEVSIESGERIKESPTAHLGRALVISVAFAANCGGVATLIGTPVNPIFKGQADE